MDSDHSYADAEYDEDNYKDASWEGVYPTHNYTHLSQFSSAPYFIKSAISESLKRRLWVVTAAQVTHIQFIFIRDSLYTIL